MPNMYLLNKFGIAVAVASAAAAASVLWRDRNSGTIPEETVWRPAELMPRCVGATVQSGPGDAMDPPGTVQVRYGSDCAVLCSAFRGCTSWALKRGRDGEAECQLFRSSDAIPETAADGNEVGGMQCPDGAAAVPFPADQLRRLPETAVARPAGRYFCPGAPDMCRNVDEAARTKLCASQTGRKLLRRCCVAC